MIELVLWILFLLIFALLPIKSLIQYHGRGQQRDTKLCVKEEKYQEKHYSQLYRPGDRKYHKIVKLSNAAKSIN